jgi:PAS domain S-box-containing protein
MDAQSLREENDRLRAVIRELRARLEEPEDIVRAIRHGEVDALVIHEPRGERIYTVRRAEVFYRAMVEDMQEGAVAVDAVGNIIYCNHYFAQLVKGDRTRMVGVPIQSFVLDRQAAFFDALTRQSSGVDRQELELRASDGAKVAVLATMNRLDLDENEKIFCLMVTDLSQKKREEQLLAEGRRKDEFLAMLAHELRNPIAPIRTAAALLGRVQGAEPRVVRARQVIERQVAHMTRLIDDLLDVSRITRGTVRLDFEPVEMSVAVNRGLETARPLIDARQHDVTVSLPLAPLWVRGDVVRL